MSYLYLHGSAQVDKLRHLTALAGPSVPNPDTITVVPFTFASGSVVLGSIQAGSMIIRAQILIITPFDGFVPTVRFGTSTDLGAFLSASDSAPTIQDQYLALDVAIQPVADILLLTVSAPGATQGTGVLLYELFTP